MLRPAIILVLLGIAVATTVRKPTSRGIVSFIRQAASLSPFSSFQSLNERSANRPRSLDANLRRRRRPLVSGCLSLTFSTLNGTCNNRRNIEWGAVDTPFLQVARIVPHDFGKLPNARVVSNIVCAETKAVSSRRRMSEIVTYFGQFIDHTITETGLDTSRPLDIKVPAGDPEFTPGGSIPFSRTVLTGQGSKRAPQNLLSSYIDASSVYGAHLTTSRALRTFTGGKLRTGPGNNLPRNTEGMFQAGDPRSSENPALTAFHTVFMREHNRIVGEVKSVFPTANDEELFQRARKVVIAEMQAIVYYEFLPAVTGTRLGPYTYQENVHAAVSNAFSTVGFRVGHTLINSLVTSISASGVKSTRKLRDSFFNPNAFLADGVDNLFRGMMRTQTQEIDNEVTAEVRDFLVPPEGRRPNLQLDLAALNIQRGRDHGVPLYNDLRTFYGLPKLQRIQQITKNVQLQIKLEKAYNDDIDKIDAWVGGICEDHTSGSLGPLFARIWLREFQRLRNGDRFHFENSNIFDAKEKTIPTVSRLVVSKSLIGKVMQHILMKNTGITGIPANPFRV